MAFEVRGERPQWETVYERLAAMEIGEVLKDSELLSLLPDAPEGSVRGAFHRAVREVEENLSRSFDRVRTIGYRMVEPREHASLAKRQHVRAKRRLAAGVRKAHAADRTKLSQEERRRIDAIEENMAAQAHMLKRLEKRQDRTEQRVAITEKDAAAVNDRVDALTDLLKRHGIE